MSSKKTEKILKFVKSIRNFKSCETVIKIYAFAFTSAFIV